MQHFMSAGSNCSATSEQLTKQKKEKKTMDTSIKKNQVAIVTGASSGMGLGITLALLERGYRVVGNSRTISKSKELKVSGALVLVDGDIGKQDTAIKVADAAIPHFRRIALLLNS